jgi:Putative addiction module component
VTKKETAMSNSALQDIEQQAMTLAVNERAILAAHLIKSLDEPSELVADPEIEKLWLIEAERRYQNYLMDKTSAVDMETAMKAIKETLNQQK